MTDIPEPEKTGSAGTQTPATADFVPAAVNPGTFDSLPITRAVEGLAATKSRGMGGEVVAGLLSGSFAQISHELSETKSDLRAVRSELDSARTSLETERVKNAALRQQISSAENNRHIRNVAIFAGPIIMGLAIEAYKNQFATAAFAMAIVGLALVLVGWLSPKKEVRP